MQILWDWNGTLLDDVDVCVKTVNHMLQRRGLKPFENREAYRNVFTFPVIEVYRRVGFDLETESFEQLSEEYMALYHAQALGCTLFADAQEGIRRLKAMGCRSFVLSASRMDHLQKQTRQCGCQDWFSGLIGTSDIYAHEKISAARQWLAGQPQEQSAERIMIGDTLHDQEVAHALGWRCVLIDRGHQSRKVLETSGCPVVSSIHQAVDTIHQEIILNEG